MEAEDKKPEPHVYTIEFNDITQAMLEDYEAQLFDVQHVKRGGGAHRYVTANVQAAFDAGWVDEPFPDFKNGKWKNTPPSAKRYDLLTDIVLDIDAKYSEFTVIDPNG